MQFQVVMEDERAVTVDADAVTIEQGDFVFRKRLEVQAIFSHRYIKYILTLPDPITA